MSTDLSSHLHSFVTNDGSHGGSQAASQEPPPFLNDASLERQPRRKVLRYLWEVILRGETSLGEIQVKSGFARNF